MMNKSKSVASVGLLCGGLMLGMGTSSVLAADFKTTLTLLSPAGTPLIDTVIFNWSTNLTTGTVTESDLTNWSYELLNGASSVYTETVIAGGVVQPIGGVSRTVGDLNFSFDLGTLTFGLFDNDLNTVQVGAATGVTYNIFTPIPAFFDFRRYENGVLTNESLGNDYTQSTIEVTASTPEPGTILGLLAVGSLGALSRKRKG
jgi:PEP-CTERM motif